MNMTQSQNLWRERGHRGRSIFTGPPAAHPWQLEMHTTHCKAAVTEETRDSV